MTVHSVSRQSVSINSSKIIDWLVNRKLLRKDYPRILSSLKRQIEGITVSINPELGECPYKHPSYLRSLKLAELVASQDTQTDFFGRASQSVRIWRDVINSYERDNLYLAELGEDIHELVSDHIPRCKAVISDRQKLMTSLRQKIKELCINVSRLEDSMDKKLKTLHLTSGETNVKLRLLEEASGVPAYLDAFIPALVELESAVSFYVSMRGYTHKRTNGSEDIETSLDTACCPTLRLLISSGHVPLYHWKTGRPPEQLGQNDDFVPSMLAEERQLLHGDLGNKLYSGQNSLLLDIDDPIAEDIIWDDSTPCDLIELSDDVSRTTLVDPPFDTDPPHLEPASHQVSSVPTSLVSGHDARPLLDTIEGRNALLNDLTELAAFLNCFIEGQIALHDLDCEDLNFHGSKMRSLAASIGGSTTLQNIIMQNAPPIVQSVSARDAVKMLAAVERARDHLTNSRISQLCMIRNKPGYLDRLVNSISDLNSQVIRVKARVSETELRIKEAVAEQEIQAAELIRCRNLCKELVGFMEKELTRICERPVQIVGPVLDL